jgi:hypothetical protein
MMSTHPLDLALSFWGIAMPSRPACLDPVKLSVWMYACFALAADAGLIEMPFVPSDRLRDTLQAYFEAQIDHYDTVDALFRTRH